ncbi:MAG: O-acetyl-ADP-ribose deacetylase [Bacteroidales bacterium]|nr:O-acetyl-ADP-ribose deacetylase [Bacteroidales bacterium]RLD37520.1 MAG: O-acetyl-ADP-ribose deacetylase [Bacteroidota bacterium]
MTIKLIQADITKLKVDAIVNAANASLLGGGGVDGAIHKAAGKELLEACKKFNGCKTGLVKITPGFLLKAKHIIHAVGPIYELHPVDIAEKLLISAYWESLQLADTVECQSIAFPNISTGVYGFPKERAAELAIHTVISFQKSNPKNINHIIFCCFEDENFRIYQKLLNV